MKKNGRLLVASGILLCASLPASAQTVHARLTGYQEVPAISTAASGEFRARINRQNSPPTIEWELSYRDLQGEVQQAHIHFGQHSVNGGIALFLCSSLPSAPAGVQPCPGPHEGSVKGTATMADIIPPGGPNAPNAQTTNLGAQGIAAGEIGELIEAMRTDVAYVNVHTTMVPSGEIRGQLK